MENFNTVGSKEKNTPDLPPFLFVKKQRKAIIITFSLIFLCFIIYALTRRPTYTSSFSVTSTILEGIDKNSIPENNILKRDEFGEIVSNFNLLYNYKSSYQSDSIKINKEIAANTGSIKVSTNKPDEVSYRISITVFDPKYTSGLAMAFVDYLNRSTPFKEKLSNERNRKEELLNLYNNQIKEMLASKEKSLLVKPNNININAFNIDLDILNLTIKKNDLYNAFIHDKDVIISSPPVIPNKPDGLSTIELLFLGSIIALIFGIFIGYFLEYYNTRD